MAVIAKVVVALTRLATENAGGGEELFLYKINPLIHVKSQIKLTAFLL